MFHLAPYVKAFEFNGQFIFGSGSNQKIIQDKNDWCNLVKIASLWKEPATECMVIKKINSIYPEISSEQTETALTFLKDNHLLIKHDIFEEDKRYSRNYLYYNYLGGEPEKIQNNLKKASVAIVGCGGIGNHIAPILACSGVGKIILVDSDQIEISNLTRQILFDETSIGQDKINVLATALKKRNSEIIIEKQNLKINNINDIYKINQPDLFIVSADSPAAIGDWFNSFCVKNSIPFINVGYINDISLIGPFYIPKQTGCYRCNDVAPWHDLMSSSEDVTFCLKQINSSFRPATFPAVNAVAAAIAAGDILKHLGQYGKILSLNKRIGIYSNELKIEVQNLEKNSKCTVCANNE